jgi:uncharacterized protein (DUF4415 family)
MKEKSMNEGTLTITQQDYEEMKASGIDDESLLKPGNYKLRRRTKTATREELHPSNVKVEFQMKLDLDVLKHFQNRAENEEIETLQLLLNEKLRAEMMREQETEALEKRLLSDKKFIAALAEEVKKAA